MRLLYLFLFVLGFATSVAAAWIPSWFFWEPVADALELKQWKGFIICCSTFSFIAVWCVFFVFIEIRPESDSVVFFIIGGMVPILCSWAAVAWLWASGLSAIRSAW